MRPSTIRSRRSRASRRIDAARIRVRIWPHPCITQGEEDRWTSRPPRDCSLIVKLRDPADSAAWREFVAIYEPLVYRLARRKGLQDADARDLCQEVFQAVAKAIDRWEPGRGQLPRLAVADRAEPADQLPHAPAVPAPRQRVPPASRSCSRPSRPPTRRPRPCSRRSTERRLFRWAADEVRGEFAPATWRAFWQTAVEDRPPGEVAAELGLSVGAVYVARSRVLARLKRRIAQFDDDAAGHQERGRS